MERFIWLLVLFLPFSACTKSDPDPELDGNTQALVNGKRWVGQATAWRSSIEGGFCGNNTVNLTIQSSLPYPKGGRLASSGFCFDCGTQNLAFTKIPLAVGVYAVSEPQPCQVSDKVGGSFYTLIGGDVLQDQYLPHATYAGTIQIIRYDSAAAEFEGIFDLLMVRDSSRRNVSNAAEMILFQKGSFKVKL